MRHALAIIVLVAGAASAAPARSPAEPLPLKGRVVVAMLKRGAVLVHLDARVEGVVVPPRFHGGADLVLRIGYGLVPPIPDLAITPSGIAATLAFDGKGVRCVLPWPAVTAAIVDGDPTSAGRTFGDRPPPPAEEHP